MSGDDKFDEFEEFVERFEPRLRRSLGAAYGPTIGRDASLDALSWAWQNWDRVEPMANPVGYLYRVGQTSARRQFRTTRREAAVRTAIATHTEPGRLDTAIDYTHELEPALALLSPQQRTAVVLIHGYGLPLREVADTMKVSVATVRQHVERALERLRTNLEANDVV